MNLAWYGAMVGPSGAAPCKGHSPRGNLFPDLALSHLGWKALLRVWAVSQCVVAQRGATPAANGFLVEALVIYLLEALL